MCTKVVFDLSSASGQVDSIGPKEKGVYRVPPNSLVTLAAVHAPGEWEL